MRRLFLVPLASSLVTRGRAPPQMVTMMATAAAAARPAMDVRCRLCSSSSSSTPINPPPPSAAAASAAVAAPSATAAAASSVAEAIKGLSVEDQEMIHAALTNPESQRPSVMGGTGIGPKDGDMLAAFTCGKCDHRMVKRFSKHAYTKGIVIVECAGCRGRHLLADNLGWLEDEAKNIEDILREKGESFVRVGDNGTDFEVRPE